MQFLQKEKRHYLTDEFIGTEQGCGIFIPANKALYNFVRENPSHTDHAQVASKALIIGRSLAASVERRTKDEEDGYEGSTGGFYSRLAKSICSSDVGLEASLLPVGERLAGSVCTAVNKVHSRLCEAISTVTNKDASSFASKYLHFHYPTLFPMVDSRAREALKWIADEEGLVFAPTTAGMSKNYATYVSFYIHVRSLFEEELGREISLRQMDNILLNRYDNWI
ncbi:hypothetical protein SAMN03159488_03170 [Pseudomonas sp. NFIX10]|uniref:hypothetical protein n=1 Tax=unclassified Pseudomonas TaxID=196821 RepID=UPI0008E6A06B|nr:MULTISPECIES: hypothetical protein [unclassified Pseudomonas]SFB35007.1 hypothetical protein SAMN03159488_03170 [Pseudomonas sp. NFIX10]SFF01093.1 hypothetical protein SAMN03159367_02759 [Pseudomonas sp. NFACC06-1]